LINGDPVPSFLSLDQATKDITIVGSDASQAEFIYDVILVSSYGTQVDSAVQYKVTVVDPCLLHSPLPPVDQLYTVGDAALTFSLDPYLQNALCPFEETLSVSGSESQPGLLSID